MIDKEIIKLAQNGDEEAIEHIVKEYHKVIHRNNRSFFLKGGDADDLVQEGFIGLIKAIKSYDETRNACFNTFANLCIRRQMITAIKNHNADKYKNLNLAMQGEDYSEHDESVKYAAPSIDFHSPEDICLGKELFDLLINHLSKVLSPLEKKTFKYLYQEYTYVEIAEFLNEPPKKIDNTIQRIKKKIQAFISLNK